MDVHVSTGFCITSIKIIDVTVLFILIFIYTLQIERKLPSESSEDWKFVRIAHLDSGGNAVKIGLYCCSPTEEGMSVVFDKLSIQPSDGTYNHTY